MMNKWLSSMMDMRNYTRLLAFGYIGLSVVAPPFASALYAYSECHSRKVSLSHTLKSVLTTFIICGLLCLMFWLPGIVYTWSIIYCRDKSRLIPYWSEERLLNISPFSLYHSSNNNQQQQQQQKSSEQSTKGEKQNKNKKSQQQQQQQKENPPTKA
jgi:glucan phosphoethanolaminetransferase (alkaline phosphatase superfamily)